MVNPRGRGLGGARGGGRGGARGGGHGGNRGRGRGGGDGNLGAQTNRPTTRSATLENVRVRNDVSSSQASHFENPLQGDVSPSRTPTRNPANRHNINLNPQASDADRQERAQVARKRRLEQEAEELRAKLRAVEAEQASLNPPNPPPSSNYAFVLNSSVPLPTPFREFVSSMAEALRDALRENESSHPQVNQASLVNRFAAQKELPTFSGDPLDWLRFKRAFEHSTTLGSYSDSENVSRLFSCLKGNARNAVQGLMMTSNSAKQIMNVLELRFGNQGVILQTLVTGLRRLPSLNKKETDLISFASTVQSNVAAMISIGDQDQIVGVMSCCNEQ